MTAPDPRPGLDLAIQAVERRKTSQEKQLRDEKREEERAPWLYAILECADILADLRKLREPPSP